MSTDGRKSTARSPYERVIPVPLFPSPKDDDDAGSQQSVRTATFRGVMCWTLSCTIFACVCLVCLTALWVVGIIIGALQLNLCPVQPMIPVWALVMGMIGIMCTIVEGLWVFVKLRRMKMDEETEEDGEEQTSSYQPFDAWPSTACLLILVLIETVRFVWLILGSYWVFNAKVYMQNIDNTINNYCDPLIYLVALYTILISYILIVVGVVSGLGAFCSHVVLSVV